MGIKVKYEQSDTSTVDVRNLRFDRPPSTSTFIPANFIQAVELSLISDFNYPNGQINYTNWFISKNGGSFEDSGQSAQNPITIPIQPQDYFLVSAKSSSQDIPTFTLSCSLNTDAFNFISIGAVVSINGGANQFIGFGESIEVPQGAEVEFISAWFPSDACPGFFKVQSNKVFPTVNNSNGLPRGTTWNMNKDYEIRTATNCVLS